MAKIRSVKKGESLDFSFDRGGEPLTGFICTLTVLQFKGATPIISRVIPISLDVKTGMNVWSGFITSTEMDTLNNSPNSNTWWAVGIIADAATLEEEQISPGSVRFKLGAGWV